MKRKTLNELTLLDKFLFDETMDDPEAHRAALQIILGQENLNLLESSQTEKEVRTASWLRTILLDMRMRWGMTAPCITRRCRRAGEMIWRGEPVLSGSDRCFPVGAGGRRVLTG